MYQRPNENGKTVQIGNKDRKGKIKNSIARTLETNVKDNTD